MKLTEYASALALHSSAMSSFSAIRLGRAGVSEGCDVEAIKVQSRRSLRENVKNGTTVYRIRLYETPLCR